MPPTKWIEYRGSHDVVEVPLYNLAEVINRTPREVPEEVADGLTVGGTSELWVEVEAPPPADELPADPGQSRSRRTPSGEGK